jgi:hypothetical protein
VSAGPRSSAQCRSLGTHMSALPLSPFPYLHCMRRSTLYHTIVTAPDPKPHMFPTPSWGTLCIGPCVPHHPLLVAPQTVPSHPFKRSPVSSHMSSAINLPTPSTGVRPPLSNFGRAPPPFAFINERCPPRGSSSIG